jgi:hypothetical protein
MGRWTVKLTGALSDGLHVMTATQFTGSGAQSVVSNAWTINVDTSIPAKPASPTLSDDNGLAIPAGSTTADTHPHIDGTGGKAGDTITVYDGGKEIGSTTVNPDGTWSFKPSPDLSPGPHDITVTDTNPAGTTSPASDPTHITIDPSIPATPPAPTLSDDLGALIPAGSTTTDTVPHISGTGIAGHTITVYDGDTALGTATVAANGSWTFVPSKALPVGPHSFTVVDTNAAGTSSAHSPATSVTMAVPSITITGVYDQNHTLIADHGSNTGTFTVQGTAIGYANGDTVSLYFDGTTATNGSSVRTQLYNVQIVDGKFSVVITSDTKSGTTNQGGAIFSGNAGDVAIYAFLQTSTYGNKASSTSYTITEKSWTFANTPATPAVPVLTDDNGTVIPAGSTTADVHPNISGTGTAGDIIKVYDNGVIIGSTTIAANGTWTFKPTTDLSKGSHDITVTDTNPAGTSGASNPVHITIDTSVPAKPAVPVITDDNNALIPAGSTTTDVHPHISGTGTAGDIITVYEYSSPLGSVKIGSDGKWTFSTDLPMGQHKITVTETNAAGTKSPTSDAVIFTINTSTVPATPAVPVITDDNNALIPAGSTTTDVHPHISGTGTAGDIITVYEYSSPLGSVKIGSDGKWTFSTDLPMGQHKITVTETNAAGMSPTSDAVIFTIGAAISVPTTPATPVLTDDNNASIPAGSTTSDGRPHISGTGTTGDIIKVYDNGSIIGSTTIGSDGKWTFTPSSNMSTGGHSISVTESNSAGTSGQSGAIGFNFVVGTAPAAPVITVVMADDAAWTNPDYMNQSGGTTSHTSEKIAGNGVAGTVVYVYDGATLIGSTTVAGNGTWTSSLLTFSKGTHDISATTVSGGVESAHSNHWSFTVGTASVPATPATPVLTDDNNALIPAGSTTNDGHPHISGTGTAGDTIKVYDNGSIIGSTTIGSDGKWTYTPSSNMSTGGHSISVTESNSAGTSGQSSAIGFNFVVGTALAAPVITAASYIGDVGYNLPSGGVAQTTYVKIGGTATAGATVYVYDGATLVASSVADTNGYWTYMIGNYSSGAHDISATTKSAAGVESAHSNHWAFTVNPTPVVVAPTETVTISGVYDDTSGTQVLVNYGGSTSDTTPFVKGNVSSSLLSGESLVVYRDGAKVGYATVVGTSWSFHDSNVSVGSHTYTARVENSLGNSSFSGGYAVTEVAPIFSASGMSIEYFGLNANGFLMFAPYLKGAKTTIWPQINGQDVYFRIYAYSPAGVLSQIADQKANIWSNGTSVGVKISGYPLNTVFVTTARLGVDGQEVIFDAHTGTYLQNIAWSVGQGAGDWGCDVSALPASLGGTAGLLSATHVVTDDHVLAASASASDSNATSDTTTAHHTVVGEHDAFKGTTGHDTVDLNTDPTSYFKESTAHIEGSTAHPTDSSTGLPAVNTLHLTGDHQVLDLTSLTGQTAAAKISGIEVIDLGGQHNTLKLSLVDVLNLGEADLFQKDGKQQMMVNGKEGDEVDLSNSHIAGLAEGEWQAHGTTEVGGVTYNVYEHSGVHTELLVQQGVQIVVH